MLSDYRTWLESELALLGNASHHAYAFGQANMAKRAIERLDEETSDKVILTLERGEAAAISTALEMLEEATTTLPPALAGLRERLHVGFSEAGGAAKNETHPADA
jgi:hypothetical protein